MKLLMISGDRSIAAGKHGAFTSMLQAFAKHWERVDVICPWSPRAFPTPTPPPRGEGLRGLPSNVFFHPSPHGLWYQPWWILKKGQELVGAHHHDVMTIHEYPPFYNGLGARWIKRRTNILACLEIHHIVGWPRSASFAEWIGHKMSRWLLAADARPFEAVRVVNDATKSVLTGWGIPAAKIHNVSSFYLDHQTFKPDPLAIKKVDLVFCARLADNKGLLEAVDAVAKLSDVTMAVIGDGPLRASAEKRALSLGAAHQIKFLGWLSGPADVAKIMQSGKAFVMNSRSEGGPRVLLEAMACGLPVLTTKVGVASDVVTEGQQGHFTNGTPSDLSQKITLLLADAEKLAAMSNRAEIATWPFEREELIGEYAEFLKKVVRP